MIRSTASTTTEDSSRTSLRNSLSRISLILVSAALTLSSLRSEAQVHARRAHSPCFSIARRQADSVATVMSVRLERRAERACTTRLPFWSGEGRARWPDEQAHHVPRARLLDHEPAGVSPAAEGAMLTAASARADVKRKPGSQRRSGIPTSGPPRRICRASTPARTSTQFAHAVRQPFRPPQVSSSKPSPTAARSPGERWGGPALDQRGGPNGVSYTAHRKLPRRARDEQTGANLHPYGHADRELHVVA
jgi:hypothetical protein